MRPLSTPSFSDRAPLAGKSRRLIARGPQVKCRVIWASCLPSLLGFWRNNKQHSFSSPTWVQNTLSDQMEIKMLALLWQLLHMQVAQVCGQMGCSHVSWISQIFPPRNRPSELTHCRVGSSRIEGTLTVGRQIPKRGNPEGQSHQAQCLHPNSPFK